MKEYYYNNSISSFFIDYYKNSIIIIPCGAESPFEHLNMINSAICNLPICGDISVYFDFTLINGLSDNRYMVMNYSRIKRKLDIINNKKIKFNELPETIKEIISKFYNTNASQRLDKSVLTNFEKVTIKNELVAV